MATPVFWRIILTQTSTSVSNLEVLVAMSKFCWLHRPLPDLVTLVLQLQHLDPEGVQLHLLSLALHRLLVELEEGGVLVDLLHDLLGDGHQPVDGHYQVLLRLLLVDGEGLVYLACPGPMPPAP